MQDCRTFLTPAPIGICSKHLVASWRGGATNQKSHLRWGLHGPAPPTSSVCRSFCLPVAFVCWCAESQRCPGTVGGGALHGRYQLPHQYRAAVHSVSRSISPLLHVHRCALSPVTTVRASRPPSRACFLMLTSMPQRNWHERHNDLYMDMFVWYMVRTCINMVHRHISACTGSVGTHAAVPPGAGLLLATSLLSQCESNCAMRVSNRSSLDYDRPGCHRAVLRLPVAFKLTVSFNRHHST